MTSVSLVGEVDRYPFRAPDGTRQIFHVTVQAKKRVSQTRGITAFAPCFDLAGMFEDVNFAKLVQQQVVSCFAVFRERSDNFTGGEVAQQGSRVSEAGSDGTSRTVEGIAPGMQITGQPGEKLQGFSPGVPNAEFFPHVKLILTLIGINLGLPLVLVLMDASETNFSGWRGAVDEARKGFRRNQQRLIERFHAPVWRWKVRQWMAEDAALRAVSKRSDIKILNHEWNKPTWPYIQPLQDASADLLETRNAMKSQRRRCAERNMDWDDLSTEIVDDNALAIAKAKTKARELNADIEDESERIHWRELISLPTPDGVSVALNVDTKEQERSDAPAAK
jgi:capsid protein